MQFLSCAELHFTLISFKLNLFVDILRSNTKHTKIHELSKITNARKYTTMLVLLLSLLPVLYQKNRVEESIIKPFNDTQIFMYDFTRM